VYNMEDLYQKYQDGVHGAKEELFKALQDENGFLIMGRDTHGFMELHAKNDGDLNNALRAPLDHGVKRRLIMDEVHKLAEPMAFILGNASNETLKVDDPTWRKAQVLQKIALRMSGKAGSVNNWVEFKAAEIGSREVYWYDQHVDRTYITDDAV